MGWRRSIGAAGAVVVMTMMAGSVLAQPAARDPRAVGPYRGLFGGTEGDADSPQAMDAIFSVFGGYDDDVSRRGAAPGRPGDPRAQASSAYAGATAALRYVRRVAERVDFRADGGVGSGYYPDLDDLVATTYGARAALNWNVNPRTNLSLAQRFRYTPFFGYSVFSAPPVTEGIELPEPDDDTRVVRRESYNYTTRLGFSRRTTERSTLAASAGIRYTDFRDGAGAGYPDAQFWDAGAQWAYRLTEHASARLGYGYRTGDVGSTADGAVSVHTIDAGIDYARALSFSRRTRFGFGMGSTGYTRSADGPEAFGEDFRYTVVGHARLTHEIGQSWLAAVAYDRRVRFVNGFADAFLTDAVSAWLAGYAGERTRLSVVAGTYWGDYGLSDEARRSTRTGYVSPAAQYALSRNLALQASYFYYRYYFGEGGAPLPPGFLPEYSRQGFRVSLLVWVPLVAGSAAP